MFVVSNKILYVVRIPLRCFKLQTPHNNLGPPVSEGPGPYSMGPAYPNMRPHLQATSVTPVPSSTGPSPQPSQLQRPMSQLVHQVSHNINKVCISITFRTNQTIFSFNIGMKIQWYILCIKLMWLLSLLAELQIKEIKFIILLKEKLIW
jgi:hypothetical protein